MTGNMSRGGMKPDWYAESIKLYRQNRTLRLALKEQHDWHLAQGEKEIEGVVLNMADEYGDSGMYERTVAALDAVLPSGIAGYEKWKERRSGLKPGPSGPLTKTPSADHDDGNLRSLADQLEGFLRVLESARGSQNKAISVWSGDVVTVARAVNALRLSAPNQQPHAVSQGWHDGTTIPLVQRGREKEYVVAVFRQHSGKVYTFAASYLNAYPLVYQYECPNGDGCDGNGCNDGCPTTGWFRLTGDDGEAETYVSLNINKGDILKGWCELPQWEEMPPANLPAPPSPAKTGGAG